MASGWSTTRSEIAAGRRCCCCTVVRGQTPPSDRRSGALPAALRGAPATENLTLDAGVVCLLGATDTGTSLTGWWDKGVPQSLAAAGYYAIGLDRRGHGASARPEDPSKYTAGQGLYDMVRHLTASL